MEILARVGSGGRITLPRTVREALGIEEADQIVFRVEGRRATIARSPDLLELAGSVRGLAARRRTPWTDVLRRNAGAVTMTTDEIMALTRGES
jgi:antitoxin PrlF